VAGFIDSALKKYDGKVMPLATFRPVVIKIYELHIKDDSLRLSSRSARKHLPERRENADVVAIGINHDGVALAPEGVPRFLVTTISCAGDVAEVCINVRRGVALNASSILPPPDGSVQVGSIA